MRLLILFPHVYWNRKMSIVRRSAIRAIMADDRITSHLTGQGWPDWDSSQSVQANADRLLPGAEAILSYKPLGHKKWNIPPLIGPSGFSGVRVETFNECHDPSIIQDTVAAGTNLAILHLANSVKDWEGTGVRTVVSPHCADPGLFATHARPWEERDIPVLLTGTLSPEVYPLRCRLAELIRAGKIPGHIHPHPGNYLPSLEACDRQEIEYAKLLGRSKISLSCCSIYGYRLAKIVESSMAGAMPICDLPKEETLDDREMITMIGSSASDSELAEYINYFVSHDKDTREIAEKGQRLSIQYYTMTHYVDRLIKAIQGAE